MTTIKHTDKRTGITYVYESESYWDKEKQQPRSRRKLIGKIDEATGEIIPTDGRGKKRGATKPKANVDTTLCDDLKKQLKEKELIISSLVSENANLKKEMDQICLEMSSFIKKHARA